MSDVNLHESRQDTSLGRWRTAWRAAHSALSEFVSGYVACASVLPSPVRERQLPFPEVLLFLNFGTSHRQFDATGARGWVTRDGVWVSGVRTGFQLSEAAGERDFMIVRFSPLGAHRFLGVPSGLIASQVTELDALDRGLTRLILSKVAAVRNPSERFAALDALIAERVAQTTVRGDISRAWRVLEAGNGCVPIARLLDYTGLSHRTLITRFRTQIGLAPKRAARLLRFHHAVRLLDMRMRRAGAEPAGQPCLEPKTASGSRSLFLDGARIAQECGYFDEPHFIREFRRFAGLTPVEYLRRR